MALTWKIDPEEFILENVCSIKTYDCCNDNCEQRCNFRNTEDILNALEGVSEVKYAGWVRREKHCQNDEVVDSGDDVIVMSKEILTKSLKMHVYNIKRQYSELKHLEANLKEDEIIISVDFSKNYNKQHHEIHEIVHALVMRHSFCTQLLVITDHMILMGHVLIKIQV